jgi:glycosyltransferase involved in cell wall biosynthesis
MESISRPSRVAFVGDYTPRKCGIATFTHDLCESIAAEFPKTHCIVGAANDRLESYAYPSRVRFEFHEKEIESYRRAADFLNINNVEVLCVQHEFGIYGGPAGSHLLALLQDVRMPVVTTLHTVLRDPNPEQRKVMEELHQRSDRFVVMTQRGHDLLRTIYDVSVEKIDVIAHGIPDVPFVDSSFFKEQFGVEGRTVLLTFGLLSPNKGIEYVIEALPSILAQHPEVVYIVLGATHPNLVAREGENYRLGLERLAEDRGVKSNVIFYNRFVELEELQEFIGAADIYITPYLNEAQIVSGTLSYAFGSGKPVISTPYWHAQELLDDDRGVLVPFRDAQAIADGVRDFLGNPSRLRMTGREAYAIGRNMVWPQVARRYMESFESARMGRAQLPARKAFAGQTLEKRAYHLPPFKLDHLFRLTDNTGILQHAIFTVPNYSEGYCTDDNARAFILTVLLEELETQASAESLEQLAGKYLAFMAAAFEPHARQFRNFMGFNREWLEKKGSEDSHARALWAAGTALGRSNNDGYRKLCGQLFERGLPAVEQFTSPRAWAFTIIAIHEYLRRFSGDRVANAMREALTARLVAIYRRVSEPGWSWFETIASYDNARIPQALIMSGYWTSQPDVLEVGLQSLRWLLDSQTSPEGHFRPIGSNGFHQQGQARADFDQQPIEAYAMVAACLEAYRVTRDERWWSDARRAFEWFLGRNDLGIPLYDSATGGCHDAIHQDRANENEGAESSLAFYLALAEMKVAQNIVDVRLH